MAMKLLDLNGIWKMTAVGETEALPSCIPGTVAGTLLAHGRIPDPYWRDNEEKVLPTFERDYSFSRDFDVDPALLDHDRVVLRCDGLDTLAEISLNGQPVARCDNMHVLWRFDVKEMLRPGRNTLEIVFRSPVSYAGEHPNPMGTFPSSLRKASCMFGWDWGLRLPDSGIWRDISLEGFDRIRLDSLRILQKHAAEGVELDILPRTEAWDENVILKTEVFGPDGDLLFSATGEQLTCLLPDPQLWYPSGYGAQPLYTVRVTAEQDGRVLDTLEKRIGLRTVSLDRSRQPDGTYDYRFFINGKPVYIKGQALVIEDAFLQRSRPDRWQRLVDNAVRSHLNCIRVWGGAYYPPEIFFDFCDAAGILVYMDFMFACSPYPTDEAFLANVRLEAGQQVRCLSTHPSLLVLCGNNEVALILNMLTSSDPMAVEARKLFGLGDSFAIPEEVTRRLYADYDLLFSGTLKEISAEYAPEIPYVTSSPSLPEGVQGGTNDYFTNGDMHFYLQYFGNLPYQAMEEMPARLLSEVGFESYPSMKTIRAFCDPEDIRPDSPVMLCHQKCRNGNETIEEYMARDYIVPEDFSHYVYLSQLMQAEILKFTCDVYRRKSDFNRGTIIWQYNDCWPVVSWSGVDYYGRWKGMQYYIRRFFAPVMATAKIEGDRVQLWVCNQSPEDFRGSLSWALCDAEGKAVRDGQLEVCIPSGESRCADTPDFAGDLLVRGRDALHLEYRLLDKAGARLAFETALFCLPKEHLFAPADIRFSVAPTDEGFRISVTSDRYAKAVALYTETGDCLFSDNWFDLAAGEEKTVTVRKEDTDISSSEQMQEALRVLSLNAVLPQR